MIQPSQAEKNRAAAADRLLKNTKTAVEATRNGPNKVFIAGLTGALQKTGTRELRSLFGVYGDISNVTLDRDS
jgi:hypothetical protein